MTNDEIYQAFIGQLCESCHKDFVEGDQVYDIPNNPGKVLCADCYNSVQDRLRQAGQ